MKKLLILLSLLTISGGAIPKTIASSPYQKEETTKNSDINYQQTNNLNTLNRNKRDFYDNYTFNINYYAEKIADGALEASSTICAVHTIILIENFKKYANNWEEFEKKFPEIEFVNLRSKLSGGVTDSIVENNYYKIKTHIDKSSCTWNKWLSKQEYCGLIENYRPYEISNVNFHKINSYHYGIFLCGQHLEIYIRLYLNNDNLAAEILYNLSTHQCTYTPKGSLKFDSICFVI